ncbi:MAG TPA: helix-turn-helix domain-containing protein [Candidatus Merdenecus merdavium]|nr:helix-turn-helix domain-containing protein [Candidatus Merdenecus merdavium]
MNQEILDQLSPITQEEQEILEGRDAIDYSRYTDEKQMIIHSAKLLNTGTLIQIRPHTRFIHFPKHTHNYIEMIYMYTGQTHHIINHTPITLKQGELLILNQAAVQEIYPASANDLAINFIILPQFFDQTLLMMGEDQNNLKDFLIGCLTSNAISIPYLHFKVSNILPVQNLLENLIWTLLHKIQNKRFMNQTTMGLLFLQLMNHMDKMETGTNYYEQEILMNVLQYIEEHYKDGELQILANQLSCDVTWLSKMIKKSTGSNFTDLIQGKRLNQACYLLTNTKLSITDISLAIGYSNFSYFHKLFKQVKGVTPRTYRLRKGH